MLEEKIVALTAEIVKLRQALEKSGTGEAAPAAAAAKKPVAVAKPKKVEPAHDADEVGTAMRAASKLSAEDKTAVRAHIAEAGCADLAELLTKPELFDAAFEFADGLLNAGGGEDDDDV